MKFVKKLFLVLIMMFALVSLFACGKDDNGDGGVVAQDEIVINFDTQGGSAIDKMTVKVSDAASFKLPADPVREGYAFIGWYLDTQFTNEFKNLEVKSGEITLYAKWQTVGATSIVVKFDSKGGSAVANVVIDLTNPDLTKLAVAPTLDGKVFLGWFLDEACTKAVSASALAGLIANKEVTLYAKWGDPAELPTTISFSLKLNGELDFDSLDVRYESSYTEEGGYEEHTENKTSKGAGKGEITVDLAVSSVEFSSLEEIDASLVIGFSANVKEEGYDDKDYPKMEIKLFLNDGCLYALIPAALVGAEEDMGVFVDLINLYNTNIEKVKELVKALIEKVKSIPADELPEGFDFSVLDRIDVDNLKLEDLIGLLQLLPEEYQGLVQNPEELSIDDLLDFLAAFVLPRMELELTEDQLEFVASTLDDVLEILKKLLPVQTETANGIKWEITDSQVKGTIDDLASYALENFEAIYGFISTLFSRPFDEDRELDEDYFEENYMGEKIYFFQPKYVDSEGVTHFYREEAALYLQNPEQNYCEHGSVVGRFYFLSYYPCEDYYGYYSAFDMEDSWKLYLIDTSLFYETDDYRYFNLYLFKGCDEWYDQQSNTFISIKAAYDLVKDDENPEITYNEKDHCYEVYHIYFGEDGKRLTEEQIAMLPSVVAEKEAVVKQGTALITSVTDMVKNSFELKEASAELTMGALLPESLKVRFDLAIDTDYEKAPLFFDNEAEYAKINAKLGLDANLAMTEAPLEFPDLTAYLDMTDMLNGLIDGYLAQAEAYLNGDVVLED